MTTTDPPPSDNAAAEPSESEEANSQRSAAAATWKTLTRKNLRLYRGVSSVEEREVYAKVGIGPVREVAKRIVDANNSMGLTDTALIWITERLAKKGLGGRVKGLASEEIMMPVGQTAIVALDQVYRASSEVAGNHLTVPDHVLYDAPLQTPSTTALLQSFTKKPTVAILYAYGIKPETVLESVDKAELWDDTTRTPVVAYLEREKDDSLAKVPGVAFTEKPTVEKRVLRDQEVLLGTIVGGVKFVELLPFDKDAIQRSLDDAAARVAAAT